MNSVISSVPAGASAEIRQRSQLGFEGPPTPPSTPAEERLLAIWEEALAIVGLGVEDDYFELGGDSLVGLILLGEVEQQLGQALPLSALVECPTIRLLAARFEAPAPLPVAHPLVTLRPEGSRPPLFFAHTILGDVLFVRQFLPYLSPDQPLYGIQARGLEGDDKPHDRFEVMAADFVQVIRWLQPKGPYFLAGLCDGSLTVVEMARLLRAAGEDVAFVGLIDPRTNPVEAPWLHWPDPDAAHLQPLRWAIRRWEHLRRRVGPLVGLAAPREGAERPALGAEMERRHEAIRRGMTAALAAYRPRPYEGAVTVFASANRMARLRGRKPGWSALARHHETQIIARHHLETLGQDLPILGARLREALDRAFVPAGGSGADAPAPASREPALEQPAGSWQHA
jgi:thioesterase domain-containing protein